MYLNPFQNLQLKFSSNASRHINYYKNLYCLQEKYKKLTWLNRSNAGRNDSGRIIAWTKGSVLKKFRRININKQWRYNKLSFIASFQFINYSNKLTSLIFFANGCVSYILKTQNHVLFDFIHFNFSKNLKKFWKFSQWSVICFLKKLIFISNLELIPGQGAKYCLSSGTKSKLMVVDKFTKTALVQLPSKIKKNISYYSIVFLNSISLEEKKKFKNTKSGYWRSFGVKSIVRGVAMNPVDHPHGGRTKAIRYQRTPWGKTTKFK